MCSFITLRRMLDHAAENNYAVPAFNISNLEQLNAVMKASKKTDSPVIIQLSSSALSYAGNSFVSVIKKVIGHEWPGSVVCIHKDHSLSFGECVKSMRIGFTSIMMDGSLMSDGKTPSSYEYNVEVTRSSVRMCHFAGVSLEGELGCLGSLATGDAGEEDGVGAAGKLERSQMLTDPDQALEFVAATGVDVLAIAIGTSHGAYKFKKQPTGDLLAVDRVAEINEKIPNTHLVLHGSSSVPQEWLKIINECGGDIPETYGVPISEIQKCIKNGVCKVNIDTDLRLAFTGAIRKYFVENRNQFDLRKYLKEAINAMTELCSQRYQEFGSAGNGSKLLKEVIC